MALELVHTSSATSLRGGAGGFCTVAMTTGMPASLEERLETLGGYRPFGDPERSPPTCAHFRLDVGGRLWHVLSTIRAAPPDAGGRANKLAHHLVLSADELVDAGPAWLLRQPGVAIDRFEGAPRWLPHPRTLPASTLVDPRRAEAWERVAGDAGWAGALVNAFLLDPSRVSCVVHDADVDALELIDEAISLMPPEERWRVTFATHFQQPVAGVACAWRFCIAGTPAGEEASRRATGLHLDVSRGAARREPLRANEGRYVELARRGSAPWWTRTPEAPDAARGDDASPGEYTSVPDPARAMGRDDRSSIDLAADDARHDARAAPGDRAGAGATGVDDVDPSWQARDVPFGTRSPDAAPSRRLITALVVTAMVTAIVSIIAALAFARTWLRPSSGPAAGSTAQTVQAMDAELLRLREETAARAREIKELEAELAAATQRAREVLEGRDEAQRRADAAEARALSAEKLLGGGAAVPHSSRATAPRDDELASPSTPPESTATRAPTSTGDPARTHSPSSAPATTPSPAPAPATSRDAAPTPAPAGSIELRSVPFDAFARSVSRLGVISSDRRVLTTLPRPVATIDVELPPIVDSVGAIPGADAKSALLTTAGASGGGVRQPVAAFEVRGPEVLFGWDASISPRRHASHLAAVDAAIPFATIVATLDDGSRWRLVPEPAARTMRLERRSSTTLTLDFRSPTLRLAVEVPEGWRLDADRSHAKSAVLAHDAGALALSLDGDRGTLTSRFVSPLHDELEEAQSRLRELEKDRPNVRPDEREFHDSGMREARERIDSLRARIAREAPELPKDLPTVRLEETSLGRVVLKVRLVLEASGAASETDPGTRSGSGARPGGGGASP